MPRPVTVSRLLAAAAGVLAALAVAAPASAHTEISVDKAQAGATDVTMTVTAEAEWNKAGIASVQVVLPPGLIASQLTLASGPTGWALSPTADGYSVGGPALPVRTNAKYAIKIAQLPATAGTVAFKTLVNYADGHVDRWIEPPTPQNPNPENPAPTITLQPAAATAPPSPSPAASPATTTAAPTSTAAAAAKPASGTGGNTLTFIVIAVIVVVVAAAVGILVWRRRSQPNTTP